MFVEAILISIIIGLLRGGKLRRFNNVHNKTIWLLLSGMLIQYMLIFANKLEEMESINKVLKYNKEILIFSYALILIGILTNIRLKSLWMVLLGYFLNFLVLASNGWRIPIIEGIGLANMENSIYNYIDGGTKFPQLGDTIFFSKPYPIPRIISLGDLVISFAIFALIQEIMMGEDLFMSGYRI